MASWSHISLKSSSVVLTEPMKKFLSEMDKHLDFDIVITDGYRSVTDQAKRLYSKVAAGESLYKVYAQDDLVAEILAAGTSVTAMAAVIARQVAKGRYLSDHMRGNAFDVRVSNLSTAQQEEVMSLASSLGGKVVDERSAAAGAHIHVEDVGDLKQIVLGAVQNYWWWAAAAISVGMLGAIYFVAKNRRRA